MRMGVQLTIRKNAGSAGRCNEIYARHGQLFNAGEVNDTHYQKYSWYRETNKHGVKWEEFNNFEKTNLRLLISIEEEYGYR